MKSFLVALIVAAGLVAGNATAQTGPNTLGKIKAAKAINVAYSADSLPFSFAGANNEPAGYSIDLCKRAIAQIGRAVGEPNLKVSWLAGSVTERLQMVATGRADLECANTTQTQSRLANVDFSNLILMVESGSVDAYAGDKIKLVGLAVQAQEPARLALLADELSFEPYAMALPRYDSALRLEVNKALTQVYLNGDIETIYAQWLGKLGRPSALLALMYLLNSIPE